jgi:hypothetical protein
MGGDRVLSYMIAGFGAVILIAILRATGVFE